MDFTSWSFWWTIIPLSIIITILRFVFIKTKSLQLFDKYSILVLNILLLYTASPATLFIFLLVTIFAYYACKYGKKFGGKSKTILLLIISAVQIIPLLYYKYSTFIVKEIFLYEWNTNTNIIIPIGLSFYTFQSIAFCIDTLKNEHKLPNIVDYLNFSAFFPQISAGPIERKENLLPQMCAFNLNLQKENVRIGISYLIIGIFFKSIIADNLASFMLIPYSGNNATVILTNNILFSLRIYFDFCGYGLGAYGLARILNINLTLNFWSPYTAANISDFWRRWHISLTLWFRDYIYFPLKGSRTKLWWLNILLVFILSGIWHGAGWNFIIWGALIGFFMILHRWYVKKMNFCIPSPIGWFLTMSLMSFIWMFFYITDIDILLKNITLIFDYEKYDTYPWSFQRGTIVMLIFLLLSISILIIEKVSLIKKKDPYILFSSPVSIFIIIILMILLRPETTPTFIYFDF